MASWPNTGDVEGGGECGSRSGHADGEGSSWPAATAVPRVAAGVSRCRSVVEEGAESEPSGSAQVAARGRADSVAVDEVNYEQWEVHIQFQGWKYLRTRMYRKDIRHFYLMSLVLENGYSESDCLYYISAQGIGLDGFKLLDSQTKVDEMLREYQDSKEISLSVIKGKRQQAIVPAAAPAVAPPPADIFDEEYNIDPPVLFAVNEEGVAHKEFVTDDVLLMGTQQSVNYEPIKTMPPPQLENCDFQKEHSDNYSDMDLDSDSEDSGDYVPGEESTDDSSDEDMNKPAAKDCDGDSEPEDIYDVAVVQEEEEEEHSEEEEDATEADGVSEVPPVLKKAKRVGPTTNSHSSANDPIEPDWFPSDDEDENLGFLDSEDDDGNEPMSFIIPSGRKTRAERKRDRIWYDESRLNPEQQFCLKLCFKDVYQFRNALVNFHIKQLRSFKYHRNCNSRMATIKCGNCKLMGHRFTNCSQQLRPDLQLRKNNSMEKRRQKAEAYIPSPADPRAPSSSAAVPKTTAKAPTAATRSSIPAFTAPRPATRASADSFSVGTSSTSTGARKMRPVRGGRDGGVSNAGTGSKKKAQKYARLKSYFSASGNV